MLLIKLNEEYFYGNIAYCILNYNIGTVYFGIGTRLWHCEQSMDDTLLSKIFGFQASLIIDKDNTNVLVKIAYRYLIIYNVKNKLYRRVYLVCTKYTVIL